MKNKLLKKTEEEKPQDPVTAHFENRKMILVQERDRLSQLLTEADTTIKHIDGALGELKLAKDAVLGESKS